MPEHSLLAPGTMVALLHSTEQGIVLSVRSKDRYTVLIEGMEVELMRNELIPVQTVVAPGTSGQPGKTVTALPPTLQLSYGADTLIAQNGFAQEIQGYIYADGTEAIRLKTTESVSIRFGHLQARNIVVHILFLGKPIPPPPLALTYTTGSRVRQQEEGVLLPAGFLPIEKLEPAPKEPAKDVLPAPTTRHSAWAEIDLHLEALIPEPDTVEELQALDIQLQALDKAVEEAILHNSPGIVVIHGVGRGVLKDNVHKRLKQHPRIRKYYPDGSGKYGQGATRAEFC